MKQNLLALIAGLLFGLGLCVSDMASPGKVLNFLDVAGNWDPSLLLVMGGALAVTMVTFRLILNRQAPLFSTDFKLPDGSNVDKRLLLGATLFGVGWGLIGYCPGPVITALGFGLTYPVFAFVAMVAGFMVHRLIFERNS